MMKPKLAMAALLSVVAFVSPGTLEQPIDDAVREVEETLQETPGGSYPYAFDVVITRHSTLEWPTIAMGPGCQGGSSDTGSAIEVAVLCFPPQTPPGIQWQCSVPRVAAETAIDTVPVRHDLEGAASCLDRNDGPPRGSNVAIDGPGEGAATHQGVGHAFPFVCAATFWLESLGVVHCQAG